MPKLCAPLTDTAIRNAKPRDKTYTLGDGEGMYFEVMPNGTRFWRMAYRQPNGKKNRLTFGKYPEVSLAEARDKRLAARKLMAQGIDPGMASREEKHAKEKVLHRGRTVVNLEEINNMRRQSILPPKTKPKTLLSTRSKPSLMALA